MSRFLKSTLVCLLTGAGLGIAGTPAIGAAFSFGTDGIQFDQDTTVDFTFIESNGKFQSSLFVGDEFGTPLATIFEENAPGFDTPRVGDFLGTPGVTVDVFEASFTFLSDTLYTLGLASSGGPTVFTTSALNVDSINPDQTQALFEETAPGSFLVKFDDTGNDDDLDFNDFTVSADVAAVPEPSLLIGLGAVVFGGVAVRRRKGETA